MNIFKAIGDWLKKKLEPPPQRVELRFVPYAEADKLIRENPDVWRVALEDGANHIFGWVYLEKIEKREERDT